MGITKKREKISHFFAKDITGEFDIFAMDNWCNHCFEYETAQKAQGHENVILWMKITLINIVNTYKLVSTGRFH